MGNFLTIDVFAHQLPRPHHLPGLTNIVPTKSRAYTRWSSRNGLFSGGNLVDHSRTISKAPEIPAIFWPTPNIMAAPTARSASMKSASTTEFPERPFQKSARSPSAAYWRYPAVGDPPFSHELLDAVAYPNPKVLSRNAHNKVQPSASLTPTQMTCSLSSFLNLILPLSRHAYNGVISIC